MQDDPEWYSIVLDTEGELEAANARTCMHVHICGRCTLRASLRAHTSAALWSHGSKRVVLCCQWNSEATNHVIRRS